MAIIPTPGAAPEPAPEPDPSQAAPEPVIDWSGQSVQGQHVELSEAQLRSAADGLGLAFDTMDDSEREFVAMFARGALAPLPAGGDPENPLIPPPVVDDAAPATSDPAATQVPGADGAGVGSDPEATGDAGQTPPAAPQPSPELATPAPGAPTFEIPSTLPPAAQAPAPEPEPQAEPLVMLPNGQMVPLSYAQALLAQQQQQQPLTTPPPVAPNPWAAPTVPTPPTPFGTEYVDERAGAEIQQVRAQQEQLAAQLQTFQQQQQVEAERQRAIHAQAIDQAIAETTAGYGSVRGLTAEESEGLLTTATQLGFIGAYSQLYPGDPRRAVGAALEATYWVTPDMRQREVDRMLEQERSTIAAAERAKALNGGIVSSPGSVPRNPAPARNRAEADAGIVAMIEQDLAKQNGSAQR